MIEGLIFDVKLHHVYSFNVLASTVITHRLLRIKHGVLLEAEIGKTMPAKDLGYLIEVHWLYTEHIKLHSLELISIYVSIVVKQISQVYRFVVAVKIAYC